jgi:hypothetical protein
MTDQTTIEAPVGGTTFSPEELTSMREQWVGYGYNADAFDAALAGDPEPAVTPDPEDGGDVPISTGPALSAAQVQDMIDALRAAGMPQDKIDEALAADGYKLEPDTRTDEEREFDASLGGRAPEGYKIDYLHRIPDGMTPTALSEANAAATAWLSALAFPVDVGARLIERAIDVGQQCGKMTPSARELWRRGEAVKFEKLAGGPDRVEERRAQAETALARGDLGFTNAMRQTGALDDAGVLMWLALHGERWAARGA